MENRRIKVFPGNYYFLEMPYSEACMAMRLAGKYHDVQVRENGVYVDGGRGPHITYGEAGIIADENGQLWATRAPCYCPAGTWIPSGAAFQKLAAAE